MGGVDAIAKVALRSTGSGGRHALPWVTMGGRLYGGRYGGHVGILCRGFPTGRPPALDCSPNLGPAGGLRRRLPGSMGVAGGSGKDGTIDSAGAVESTSAMESTTGVEPATSVESATRVVPTTMVGLTTMVGATSGAGTGARVCGWLHGGRFGGHEGILCRGFPTGRPPARTGPAGRSAAVKVRTT